MPCSKSIFRSTKKASGIFQKENIWISVTTDDQEIIYTIIRIPIRLAPNARHTKYVALDIYPDTPCPGGEVTMITFGIGSLEYFIQRLWRLKGSGEGPGILSKISMRLF